jgi:hypothetical protein
MTPALDVCAAVALTLGGSAAFLLTPSLVLHLALLLHQRGRRRPVTTGSITSAGDGEPWTIHSETGRDFPTE